MTVPASPTDALGPFASFRFRPGFSLTLRVQSEFGARNRPQGTRFWAMALCPF